MRKSFLIVPLFLFACQSGEVVFQEITPNECPFPQGAYLATYTKLSGECGRVDTESFSEESVRTWFPLALDLEDCERVVTCTDGVIHGSSFCERTVNATTGTLDGTLTLDTRTGSGTLELRISATNYHRSSSCASTYEVTYSGQ